MGQLETSRVSPLHKYRIRKIRETWTISVFIVTMPVVIQLVTGFVTLTKLILSFTKFLYLLRLTDLLRFSILTALDLTAA